MKSVIFLIIVLLFNSNTNTQRMKKDICESKVADIAVITLDVPENEARPLKNDRLSNIIMNEISEYYETTNSFCFSNEIYELPDSSFVFIFGFESSQCKNSYIIGVKTMNGVKMTSISRFSGNKYLSCIIYEGWIKVYGELINQRKINYMLAFKDDTVSLTLADD